ncbi:branched-chain amino acid ABC transporter permease [Roseovarius rhodophyticola]|uniref:Branched-chain amino acid ABC transporter permease n=1 Tax=Roseovarius rhodophyticola TaxID=3080827 RepID=A0ABZ2TKE5_9RHOB|nr:branched-chain amino acid ABC transporter permease [Roseovarius sp. W115]MDV2927874.1 branched-chain amino acid ABC transporter permease [Roseovarius sp. W115]
MEIVIQILITGLTLGAMYALAAVGLSLIYGTLGMFNMAHGLFMTLGAYAVFSLAQLTGVPLILGILTAMTAGAVIGVLTHLLIVRFMLSSVEFETNILVATAGLAILLEDIILKFYGGYPYPQPVTVSGKVWIGGVVMTNQAIIIFAVATTCIGVVAWLLLKTRFGRAIRATAMNRDAARLMGVRTNTVYLQVMALAGALAGVAGLMISTQATLSPQMGGDPLLKAFVICVVAGLGNVWGAGVCAIVLALIEAAIGFYFGVRFGFPTMLMLVIIVLIWRPLGLFGKERVVRL